MAATTASSRGIAARLVLSVRAVDNHLQNASSKLGVTSRDELAPAPALLNGQLSSCCAGEMSNGYSSCSRGAPPTTV
jgi:hypothetical protein